MAFVREALDYIVPPHCINVILDEQDYFNVKLPQVLKIASSRDAYGLSILSVLLELFSFTSLAAYSKANNFPFSTYGEGIFLALQNFLIALIAIFCTYSTSVGFIFSATYSLISAILYASLVPLNLLVFIQTINLPIMLSSKILQIYTNWKNGSTGQLSAITLCLFALGSTARIFTSIQDTGDFMMIVSCASATVCNYILVIQLLYYWNSPPTVEKKKK